MKSIPFYCHSSHVDASIQYEQSPSNPWESNCLCTGCGFEWVQNTESLLSEDQPND